MNIFNFLSSILFTKKRFNVQDIGTMSEYQPYIVNRWCSMLNKSTCHIVNTTVNSIHQLFDDKRVHYNFLFKLMPRFKFQRINYIKKTKQSSDDDNVISKLAKSLELSKREIKYYKEQLNLDLSKYDTTKSKY